MNNCRITPFVNCYYTDTRSVSGVSTSPRYFVLVLSLLLHFHFSDTSTVEKKHKVLVSDDVERECLKTSNKGSGSHTGEKGFSHTGICTQGIFGGGKKKLGLEEPFCGWWL